MSGSPEWPIRVRNRAGAPNVFQEVTGPARTPTARQSAGAPGATGRATATTTSKHDGEQHDDQRKERSMRMTRPLRLWLTSAALVLVGLTLALLVAPAASADLSEQPIVTTGTPGTAPMMLASTGLDITVPVLVGLGALVLGTVMVGWAFLATGRRSQHR
jgi:hypothetical protein